MKHFNKRIIAAAMAVIAGLFTFILILNNKPLQSNAKEAAFSLKAENTVVKRGNTLDITLTVTSETNLQQAMASITYDAAYLQFLSADSSAIAGSSGVLTLHDTYQKPCRQKTYTLTFQALETGSCAMEVTNASKNNYTTLKASPSSTSSLNIKIVNNEKKASDSSLKDLLIGTGELSPKWDSNIYEYQVTVPKDTNVFTYSATPSTKKATITSTGPKQLKDGNNTFVITVTAPSGDSSQYTILVKR